MKRKLSALLIAAFAICASSFAQKEGFTQFKLDNGMTVYLFEDPTAPEVQGRVVIRAGAVDEPAEFSGLAHCLEHMMFKGNEKIGTLDWEKEKPLYEEIAKLYDQLTTTTDEVARLELIKKINEKSMEAAKFGATDDFSNLNQSLGGSGLNAYTSYDVTAYIGGFPAYQMEKWLEISSERFLNPVFRSFQAEMENVFEEYNMYQDNIGTHIFAAMRDKMFKGTPYERDIIGAPEHIKNQNINVMTKFYKDWYVGENMALILVGNFKSADVIPTIKAKFGRIQAGKTPERKVYPAADFSANTKSTVKLGYYPQVNWVYNGLPSGHPDELLLQFAISMLTNNSSTGLLDKITLNGDVLGAYAYAQSMRDRGVITITAIPYYDSSQRRYESDKATEKIVMEEVNKLKSGNIENWLFDAIKQSMLQEVSLMNENSSSMVNILTESFQYNIPVDFFFNLDKKIQAITKDDVMRIAKQYLNADHLTISFVEGDPKKNKIKKPEIKPLDPPTGVETAYSKEFKKLPMGEVVEKYNNLADVKKVTLFDDVNLFVTENPKNNIFSLTLKYGVGKEKMPKLGFATQLMNSAGVLPSTDAQTLRRQFSELGAVCSYGVNDDYFYISIQGEDKNLAQICELVTRQTLMPKLDKKQMDGVIGSEFSRRYSERKNSNVLASALVNYALYKEKSDYIDRIGLEEIYYMSMAELTADIIKATNYALDIHYVGNVPLKEASDIFTKKLPMKEGVMKSESPYVKPRAAYKAQTIYFLPNTEMQQAKVYFYIEGKPYTTDEEVAYMAFNEYFSGSFSGLVMNEIREKRSMAYTAYGLMSTPPIQNKDAYFIGYVGTQPDKVADAVDVYMKLLKDMPLYPERIDNIKTSLRSALLSNKPSFRSKSFVYDSWNLLGYKEDPAKVDIPKIDNLTFETIDNFYKNNIKDKNIVVVIMGDPKTINVKQIQANWGKVTKLGAGRLFSAE